MKTPTTLLFLSALIFAIPALAHGDIAISEIMFDLEGADTGREWIEIANTGENIDIKNWKLFENNTHHVLTLVQGESVIGSGMYAVIADNKEKFLTDWPTYAGVLFTSSFSLNNEGESLIVKNENLTEIDSVAYTRAQGGAGDGNSLQLKNNDWFALVPTPGAEPASLVTPPDSDGDMSSENLARGASEQSASLPNDSEVFSSIKAEVFGLVGADVVFKGSAVGYRKEPLSNIRFVWNFGDGSTSQGETITHVYDFPGDYIVTLTASYGQLSHISRHTIHVVPADVTLSNIKPGVSGFVEISNNTSRELDLSRWSLRSAGYFFSIPSHTIILSKSKISFPAKNLGFSIGERVELVYPSGEVATSTHYAQNTVPAQTAVVPTVYTKKKVGVDGPVAVVLSTKTPIVAPEVLLASVVDTIEFENKTQSPVDKEERGKNRSLWDVYKFYFVFGGLIVVAITATFFLPKKSEVDEIKIIE